MVIEERNNLVIKFTVGLLILFCIHYIPIETRNGIGPIKLVGMAICIWLLFTRYFVITKALIIGLIYYLYMLMTASFHPDTFRWSTILFRGGFIFTFIAFYHFIYVGKCFKLDTFLKFITTLMIAYTITLLVQQALILVGIRIFPLVNLVQFLDRGYGANSLTYEPSTFAKIMGVLYYAYLKMNELKTGTALSIKDVFNQEHKKISLAFIYCMLTMGSGTAFIVLAVLSLYFLKSWNFLLAIPIFMAVYFMLDYMEVNQFKRANAVIQAVSTGNREMVVNTDGSAATRIKPMLNTLTLDLSKPESWLGAGIDSTKNISIYSDKIMVGEINDFGLIAYVLGLLLVFSCSIKFFSLPTIMFFIGVGGGTSNISFAWGILMVFTCIRYFYENTSE